MTKCYNCDRVLGINEEYWTINNREYCEECWDHCVAENCIVCNSEEHPDNLFYNSGSKQLCAKCYVNMMNENQRRNLKKYLGAF